MDKKKCSEDIEKLLKFAIRQKLIEKLDIIPCRNVLMETFNLKEFHEEEVEYEASDTLDEILDRLLSYAFKIGILSSNTAAYRDLFDTKIMGFLMPRESEVVSRFMLTSKSFGIKKATDDFYSMCKSSNYIRMDRINKNLYWNTETEYGNLEITINLSKPEKDPKDIAAAKVLQEHGYPRCLLCIENVGFSGNLSHPARQNHRVIPVKLQGENWYFQYSPYVYYNEHCIVFKGEHVPMKISKNTFIRLFDFVDEFPHYFIGSNADLPIVGGSILTHEHFQGGRHVFPMEVAKSEARFIHEKYTNVKVSIIKWPLSVIRLSSKNKNMLIKISDHILTKWRGYNDEGEGILSYTHENGKTIDHNTITPIVRINKSGEYEIDLVLRNNRTTKEYPDGIFHPHKELHHIKKENIGLIEVMGLAVLPARLKIELSYIEDILMGCKDISVIDEKHELHKHKRWIETMQKTYGIIKNREKAQKILAVEVGNIFSKVLLDAGVYKKTENGFLSFVRFMNVAGFNKMIK